MPFMKDVFDGTPRFARFKYHDGHQLVKETYLSQ